jgi:hypothetical protein
MSNTYQIKNLRVKDAENKTDVIMTYLVHVKLFSSL